MENKPKMNPSEKFLAGLKTYIFAGIAILCLFATVWFGPLKMNFEFATKVIQSIEAIVFLVAGKSVAAKAVEKAVAIAERFKKPVGGE